MTLAYLGLGSNIGDREAFIVSAIEALGSAGVKVVARSSLYETAPVGPPQRDFINAVVAVDTGLEPSELLAVVKRIEAELGRTESEHWGPREIDLDILLFGDLMLEEAGITIPHPQLTKRQFVVVPLLEIDPDLVLPSGEPLSVFADRDPVGVHRLATS